MLLIAGGFDHDVPKGYVYFALAFSVAVEMLNIRLRKRSKPVHLHEPYAAADRPGAESGGSIAPSAQPSATPSVFAYMSTMS